MLPTILRSSRALPYLSVLSVGLSLAAITGLASGPLSEGGQGFGHTALITALPTLVVGTAWAAMLRWRRTTGRRQIRLGWLLSIPLAALNGGLAGALLLSHKDLATSLLGFVLGLTLGAMVWAPAMLVTLLVFGAPIAWSQRQARRGLAGAERGETLVGAVCLLLSAAVLVTLLVGHEKVWTPTLSGLENVPMVLPLLRPGQVGTLFLSVVAALGVVTSLATMALAVSRGRRRRALVEAAESGARPDYRVEHTDAGRVLIRVRPASTDDYRQADLDEESFALDPEAPDASRPAAAPLPLELPGRSL